jgi:predicted MPP superfamily phosphohydrolase
VEPHDNDAARAAQLRQTPRRYGAWRGRLVGAAERLAVALGGHALYRRRHLRQGGFLVRRVELSVPRLPSALEGLCCAQLSDLHAGPFLRSGDLRDVVDAVNAEAPDLVFLTGDLITHDWRDAEELVADLGRLRPRLGALAVFGNHDYRGRKEGEIARVLGSVGVRVLRNESVRFRVAEAVVAVVGLEDLEESRSVDVALARRDLEPGDVELLLCHHPAGGPALARQGCVAVFSGHTHGGQLDLPFLGALGPAHPGASIDLGSTRLLVNRGLGTIGAPLRLGASTEILVVRLRGAPQP